MIDVSLATDKDGLPAFGKQFKIGAYALRRHAQNHSPATLARGAQLAEDLTAAGTVKRLQNLTEQTDSLLQKAETAGDATGKLVRECRENLP
jgi:hypothetical protein